MARDMKDSGIEWIGKIPVEWNVRPIKNSFSIVSGSTPNSDKAEYWDGDIAWITPADFKTIDKYTSGGSRYITKEGYNSCSTSIIPKGSIIFSKRAPIGSVVINTIDLCTNQGCLSCIKNDKTDSVFFYYIMSVYDDVFNQFGSGTTFKEISATTFSDFILPLPPLEEQKLISSFLDSKCSKIDKAIEATKASIEEYKKLRQNIITEAVTKGLNSNVMMKESNTGYIGFIPSNWELKKLRYIGSCQNGISKGAEFFGDEGFPFVNYSDVYKNTYLPIPSGKIRSTKEEQIIYSVEEGDIFFTRTSETIEEIGFSSVCLKTIPEATFAGFLIRVRPTSNELDVRYSAYYFRSDVHRRYFTKEMNLVTRASLGQTLLKNIPVLIPPMEEQQRIADYLDRKCSEIDSLIKSKEKLIEELTAYRKSLIYEYVTGKKEVPAE